MSDLINSFTSRQSEPEGLDGFDSDSSSEEDTRTSRKYITVAQGQKIKEDESGENLRKIYETGSYSNRRLYESTWRVAIRLKGSGKGWKAFLTALFLSTLFSSLFVVLYTAVPGVYDQLIDFSVVETYALEYIFPICFSVSFALFILDVQYAETLAVRKFGYAVWTVCAILIVIATLSTVKSSPVSAYVLYIFAFPIIAGYVKLKFFRMTAITWYLRGILFPQVISAILGFIAYPIYMTNANRGWDNVRNDVEYLESVGCDNETISRALNESLGEDCSEAFIVYFSPLMLATVSLMNSIMIIVLVRGFVVLDASARDKYSEEQLARAQARQNREIQVLIIIVLLFLFSSYISTSLVRSSTAGLDFAVVILGFSIVFIFIFIYAAIGVFGSAYIRNQLQQTVLGKIVNDLADSDWVKALILFFLVPLVIFILVIGFIIQSVRKYTPLGKKLKSEEERNYIVSEETMHFLRRAKDWEWGSVLLKSLWIGVILFVVAVIVGRVTNIFLSWLSEILVTLPLYMTTVIFIFVGLGMFMLPPVPGLPVYLAGGIVLASNAQGDETGWSFINAAMYACFIVYILKLLAIVLQQKVIGQMYGRKSVAIRAAVNINSMDLRAMKVILSKPGFTFPKICILVGGPDWPTSVLTGILGLPLSQMLIGSLPVIVIVFPMGFSGAVLTLTDEDNVLLQYSPAMLTLSLMIQGLALILAVHFTKKARDEKIEEIEEKAPIDEEVREYQEAKQAAVQVKNDFIHWDAIGKHYRIGHCVANVFMITSIHILQFLGTLCFLPFEVQNSIDEDLDGSVFNVVTDLGWFVLGMFTVACLYLIVFTRALNKRVSEELKENENQKLKAEADQGIDEDATPPKLVTGMEDAATFSKV
mmetsp:Transcript_10840/g.12505  ORF Transcript_10840/g.12505 Transcript_10840/m.12505 type:complete len:875 (+) Transcript_10840:413-3037(+)